MDELTAVIMECMVSDLKTSKKYQINKSRLIRLAQNYCTYKMPKMNQIQHLRSLVIQMWMNMWQL